MKRRPTAAMDLTLPSPPPRCWSGPLLLFCIAALVVASFVEVGVDWGRLMSMDAAQRMGRFLGEMAQPSVEPVFVKHLGIATLETLAMSAIGTLLAAFFGLWLALPASRTPGQPASVWRLPTRGLLNVLRSVPELVWAALLLISAGLGPLAGTLALALHTTGVLGRLFTEVIENAPDGPACALRVQGIPAGRVLLYATFPLALPQLLSYALYRWENNIRAAAVLGVVGGGGLGQMLSFHMGLFHMRETGSILISTIVLVVIVDLMSTMTRRILNP